MPKPTYPLAEIIKSKPIPEKVEFKTISHSQFTVYNTCNYQWYLRYTQKVKLFTGTIHTVFGTAMHETLQEFMKVMYTVSAKAAHEINLEDLLMERLLFNYENERVENNAGSHFSTSLDLQEFFDDGVEILRWFKGHRDQFFSVKGYVLLGIEIPIMQPLDVNEKVYFNGFLDIVLGEVVDGKIIKIFIYDFKTSSRGWKDDKEKKDEAKIAQVLIYKKYFAKQYEIPIEMIEPVFMILKRKVYENCDYPQPRASCFRPAHGTAKMRQADFMIDTFVKECFTPAGEYNLEREYTPNPSPHNCRFCPFRERQEYCTVGM